MIISVLSFISSFQFSCRVLKARISNLVFLLIALCSLDLNGQINDEYKYTTEVDSLYFVQFIALKDSTRTYRELYSIGNTIKEYVNGPDICRYSLGYYIDKNDAFRAMYELQSIGFTDAFIRSRAIPRAVNQIPDGDMSYVEGQPSGIEPQKEEEPIEEAIPMDNKEEQKILERMQEFTNPGPYENVNFSILYTGKSYGALGSARFQSEHELATEYALKKEVNFKLVSHACWRAYGITIFMPSDEPKGGELELILDKKAQWKVIKEYPGLKTNNVLMFRDPDREHFDMLNIVLENKNTFRKFPEIKPIDLKIYTTEILDGKECFIVLENHAEWPELLEHWRIGEINRLDFGKTGRLYELPYNQGNFDSRASVIKELVKKSLANQELSIKADLGHRNGYFGMDQDNRMLADIRGLSNLGYDMLLPFEFELSLGNDKITSLKEQFPDLTWIATNVNSNDKGLFKSSHIIENQGVKIGFLGLVNPEMAVNLPGEILKTLNFEDVYTSAQATVDSLLDKGADVIVALSNMNPGDNANLSMRVSGIDIVLADIISNGNIALQEQKVSIESDQERGLGAPLLTTKNYDYGAGVGIINMSVKNYTTSDKVELASINDKTVPVNDDIKGDAQLLSETIKGLTIDKMEKGTLMIPSFVDLNVQQPKLATYDEVTKHGRISKGLWEKFLANLLRNSAPSEISLVRKVRSFPPLIGKLHQREVHSWLRMEDEIVIMDMKGRDIRRLMEADQRKTLISSGLSSFEAPIGTFWFVMGRFLREDVYYRVATTNIVINGEFSEHFRWAIRQKSKFTYKENGLLKSEKLGQPVKLKDFVINDLTRIRSLGKSTTHHKNIAELLIPSQPYEKLFSFVFDKPTLWGSFNKSYKGDGYESVPESRIINRNSLILGAQGGFSLSLDKAKYEWVLGTRVAYAQQSADVGEERYQRTETMDDININLTYRYKGTKRKALHPFARLVYDSEFTSTFNRTTETDNPRQSILRTIVGFGKERALRWPVLELGLTAENDFSNNHYQYGIQGRSVGRFPLDKSWNVIYSMTNHFNYYIPTKNDTNRELSFRYNMIHELLIPLYGDISLSIAGDFFFFKGKTEINSQPGMNMLLRLGFTYNRVWKPKYQRLF